MVDSAHDDLTAELTAAIQRGDMAAFERFYRTWFDFAFAQAQRLTAADESFCLDIVQEVMMRAIRSMKPLPNEAALRSWLSTTTRRCAIDSLRREMRRRRREALSGAAIAPEADPDLGDRSAWLRRRLAELDDQTATLLTLRHRFQWTLQQIGQSLRLTPGAVDGRLRRTMDTLRREAREAFDD